MAQARLDENRVTTLLGASTVDDLTPIRAWIDPTSHRLLVDADIQSLIAISFPSRSTGTYNAVTVTASATLIKASNANRLSLQITNTSGEVCYIGFDTSVSSTNGFPLAQNDVLSLTGSDLYTGAVYGITASSTANIRYFEI
jgi:hypothetical protein